MFAAMFMQFKERTQMIDYYNELYIATLLLHIPCQGQQPSMWRRCGYRFKCSSLSQTDNL
jgi:hypothetical protein